MVLEDVIFTFRKQYPTVGTKTANVVRVVLRLMGQHHHAVTIMTRKCREVEHRVGPLVLERGKTPLMLHAIVMNLMVLGVKTPVANKDHQCQTSTVPQMSRPKDRQGVVAR